MKRLHGQLASLAANFKTVGQDIVREGLVDRSVSAADAVVMEARGQIFRAEESVRWGYRSQQKIRNGNSMPNWIGL